jgi:RND family efflux transporter MFP subunit
MFKRQSLATVLVCCASLWPVPGLGAEPALLVPVTTVVRGSAAAAMSLDGTLQPVKQSTLAAQVGGNVVALLVKAGDTFRAGQPLLRLDPREPQAGVARADAAVAQAQAALTAAQQNVDRTRELRTQNFISQAALDLALTQLAGAQAGLAQAAAERHQATLVSGYAEVTAPFAGVVLATHVEVGDLAVAGRALITLYEPGTLRAVVQVPVSRAAFAQAARELSVELPDGRLVKPADRQVLPSTDPVSQTVEWRLPLSLADSAKARPGQSVRVRFSVPAAPPQLTAASEPRTALSAPVSAILRRGELTAVYVLDHGQFALRPVRTGAMLGDRVELLAGVQEGQVIAVDAVRAGLQGARPATGPGDPR